MLGEIHARNCAEKQTMLEANIYVCWMSSVLVANTCLSGDVMPRRTIKLAEEFQAFFFSIYDPSQGIPGGVPQAIQRQCELMEEFRESQSLPSKYVQIYTKLQLR